MVKAQSLLYAIYICLIVSVICYALLFFSSLYAQLNLHYNLNEELYLYNHSFVNYALAENQDSGEIPIQEENGVSGTYSVKPYGLLKLLTVQSILRQDTVSSVQFIGNHAQAEVAVHLSSSSRPLSAAGRVRLVGQNFLPSVHIETAFISDFENDLETVGKISLSEARLPSLDPVFTKMFEPQQTFNGPQQAAVLHDSLNFNSFRTSTKKIMVPKNLEKKVIKGNYMLYAKDSIVIKKTSVLQDVIVIAPVVIFEDGFVGNLQVFATKSIELGEKVVLNYPSSLCLYNNTDQKVSIEVKKECKLSGAIVLFGNDLRYVDNNSIAIAEGGEFVGDIYCTGKFMSKSNIKGSLYTNRFYYQTESSDYENLICGIEINAIKRPQSFMPFPLFETLNANSYVVKRVL